MALAAAANGEQLHRTWPCPEVVDGGDQQVTTTCKREGARVIYHGNCARQGQPDLIITGRQGNGVAVGFEGILARVGLLSAAPGAVTWISTAGAPGAACITCTRISLAAGALFGRSRTSGPNWVSPLPVNLPTANTSYWVSDFNSRVTGPIHCGGAYRQDGVYRDTVTASLDRFQPAAGAKINGREEGRSVYLHINFGGIRCKMRDPDGGIGIVRTAAVVTASARGQGQSHGDGGQL